jgi:hypothetical protein
VGGTGVALGSRVGVIVDVGDAEGSNVTVSAGIIIGREV